MRADDIFTALSELREKTGQYREFSPEIVSFAGTFPTQSDTDAFMLKWHRGQPIAPCQWNQFRAYLRKQYSRRAVLSPAF